MSSKEITLQLAQFLDSPAAKTLRAPDAKGQRTLVQAFLEACYLDLGLAPKHLDGDAMEALFTRHLPARLSAKDPLAPHAAQVVEAFLDYQKGMANMPFVFEATLALHRYEVDFLKAIANPNLPRHGRKQTTVKHVAQKLGRNDPCSCGSGKKYKQCHGK